LGCLLGSGIPSTNSATKPPSSIHEGGPFFSPGFAWVLRNAGSSFHFLRACCKYASWAPFGHGAIVFLLVQTNMSGSCLQAGAQLMLEGCKTWPHQTLALFVLCLDSPHTKCPLGAGAFGLGCCRMLSGGCCGRFDGPIPPLGVASGFPWKLSGWCCPGHGAASSLPPMPRKCHRSIAHWLWGMHLPGDLHILGRPLGLGVPCGSQPCSLAKEIHALGAFASGRQLPKLTKGKKKQLWANAWARYHSKCKDLYGQGHHAMDSLLRHTIGWMSCPSVGQGLGIRSPG